MKKLSFFLICSVLAISCSAEIITVNWDGSGDYLTIQEGIDAAEPNDTVVVAQGIYTGDGNRDLDFLGKAITVRSTDPNDWNVVVATIVDCEASESDLHRGFYFHSGEDASSVLAGFTITNGYMIVGHRGGAGICVVYHSPYPGGGSSPTIRNCIIKGNSVELSPYIPGYCYGGGIFIYRYCSPTIRNCAIYCNSIGAWGYGGGIGCYYGSSPKIQNCTISGNTATGSGSGGGGICSAGSPTITNCIIWGNSDQTYGSVTISYSDVEGGFSGLGNIDADPLFADPCNGDYHLKSTAGRWNLNSQTWVIDANTSPCIDTGNPGCPLGDEPNDANNVRINMGAYGGTAEASKTPANWGILADLTNDRIVDFNDLAAFVDYWLESGECIPSDLNRNESVEFIDFAKFAIDWQTGAE